MISFLQGPGFLGTYAGLGSDLSLVIMVAAVLLLTVGVLLAITRRYGAHRWVQTAAVCLSLIPVAVWMIRFFDLYILTALPANLGKSTYALATTHAIIGAIGVVLGVFIVIRANQLEAQGRSLNRYKTPMRIAYVLYVLGLALGIALYLVTYVYLTLK